jgi:hypothetical protein
MSTAQDGFESYDDIMLLTEKDITSLAKGFAKRTNANRKIVFGLRRTNLLKATVRWVQAFRRISCNPSILDIDNAVEFRAALAFAHQRAQAGQHNADESNKLSKAADPGKLKKQRDWVVWSRSLANYLSAIPGQDGVPTSYVIWNNKEPDYDDKEDDNFEQLFIVCAPLEGIIYKTDAHKVHQLIHGFVQGKIAETWIKPKEKRQDSRM